MQKMMRTRDELLRKMKKNRCEDNKKHYKSFRNLVRKLKESKLEYYQNSFAVNGKNLEKI